MKAARAPRPRPAARRELLAWYRAHRRDLPWRRTRDPYAIWISEAMLQQTRVETVIPYWERFLERFPDANALASADTDDVLSAWSGLGYYSRARNLQRAAQQVVEQHGGALPSSPEALRALPGVGRYTAGALASIAFDAPEPVLDGNVTRVLARFLDIREPVSERAVRERLWREATVLVRGEAPGDLNQALMELGATVCTPRAPRCPECPWRGRCAGRAAGSAEQLPRKAPKRPPVAVEAVAGWLERRGRVLAVQRPARGLLAGMWELPGGALEPGEEAESALRRHFEEGLGLRLPGAEALGSVEHLFSHRRLRLHVFRCKPAAGRVRRRGWPAHRWVSPGAFEGLAQGGPTRKARDLVAEQGGRLESRPTRSVVRAKARTTPRMPEGHLASEPQASEVRAPAGCGERP